MAAGLAVVFACGVTWLTLFAPGADGRSLQTALAFGFYPFVLVDLAKLAIAAAVMPAAWKLLGSDFAD
jgi:biotin transport system substrate-specific component